MVRMKGNCETTAMKQEAQELRKIVSRVSVEKPENSERFGNVHTFILDFFKPHSLEYRTHEEYLAPALYIQGTNLNSDEITQYLDSLGIHIFALKQKELGATTVLQYIIALSNC